MVIVVVIIIIIEETKSRTGKSVCVHHIKGRRMALLINIMQILWGVFK